VLNASVKSVEQSGIKITDRTVVNIMNDFHNFLFNKIFELLVSASSHYVHICCSQPPATVLSAISPDRYHYLPYEICVHRLRDMGTNCYRHRLRDVGTNREM